MKIDIGFIIFSVAILMGLFITIFTLLTVYENWGRHRTQSLRKKEPRVCIIIPCYNEAGTVAKTIESLLELDYPKKKLEIMVIDDGSTDDTYAVAKIFVKRGVKVYKKKNGGKHTALNYALEKTNADFVGALDADSTVAPDALRKIVWYFQEKKVMAVTPSMKIDTPKGFLRRIQSIEFILGIYLRRVFADLGSQHVTPGPFTIYRKFFFEKYGYYRNAHRTEDIEIALRIQSHHYVIENATDAYVYTHGPDTWSDLYKQRLRWYYGFISNLWDYRRLFSKEHGNLGLFILPMSIFSVAVMGLVLVYTFTKMATALVQNVYQYWLIDFDLWELLELNFDAFFITTSPTALLGILTLILGIFVIVVARFFAGEKKLLWSYVLFALFYSWLYVFWWVNAFFHKVFKQEPLWGHKSNTGV